MKIKSFYAQLFVPILIGLIFVGCGSSSSSSKKELINPVTGVFVDSAVSGLNYKCSSGNSGVTNTLGEFTCESGDKVGFTLGSISLGEVTVAKTITPHTLFQDNEEAALNFAQLVQTLDSDGDPNNGITINEQVVATLLHLHLMKIFKYL